MCNFKEYAGKEVRVILDAEKETQYYENTVDIHAKAIMSKKQSYFSQNVKFDELSWGDSPGKTILYKVSIPKGRIKLMGLEKRV